MTIHQRLIKIFSKHRKYFVVLQGPRGSGKQQFANELQSFFYQITMNNKKELERRIEENPDELIENINNINNIECKTFMICSIDDYYNENNYSFGKNLSLSYSYCKNKAKKYMKDGYSIIYNNTNLDEKQYTDIVHESMSLGYCPIILRFFTSYSENEHVHVSRYYHPITQQTCSKQTIIRDNIVMFHFKNEFEIYTQDGTKNKKILPMFGVKSDIIEKKDNQYIFDFDITSPNMEQLKFNYITRGWFNDIPQTPNLRPKILANEIPELDLGVSASNNEDNIPSSIKHETENLDEKIAELESQLDNFNIGTVYKSKDRRRQRCETDEDNDDNDDDNQ
jgi:predicted kinase